MPTNSSDDFTLPPRKAYSKRLIPAGSMFMKPSVQCHLLQDYPEEYFITQGLIYSVNVGSARRLIAVNSYTFCSTTVQ
ncbi:hypothetical protein TNCV_2727191 [Trichonephila clavipes]|nr:hypothetical protein TNCV_2727191 [Trichonephila clavipes]